MGLRALRAVLAFLGEELKYMLAIPSATRPGLELFLVLRLAPEEDFLRSTSATMWLVLISAAFKALTALLRASSTSFSASLTSSSASITFLAAFLTFGAEAATPLALLASVAAYLARSFKFHSEPSA
jgi:hypothetical protein